MTIQLKNKPEHLIQTYNFKHVINHVDITQAEAEFIEKYGHLLNDNNLITRTLVDYKAKTITIEGASTKPFSPSKKVVNNRGFIFDLPTAKGLNDFIRVFEPLGITSDDFTLYNQEHKLVTTSNKLTKDIINNLKEVIRLDNREEEFTLIKEYDKRPTVQNILDFQLEFLLENKLHEDDITSMFIETLENYNVIIIKGKQNSKYKTYSDDVEAIINSCIIVDRFESLLESALKEGNDNVIQRVISYQHPIVDSNSLELLESSVNITQVLEDITNKDGDIEPKSEVIESSTKDNLSTNFSIADFATETLPEPQYPVVETGDKIYDGKVQTSFELQEVTFGQPDKLSLSDLARKSKDSFYIKLTSSKTNNEKLIDVLELTEDDYYYTKDQTAITITSNHVTVDFIKDKIKQLGGHSKLMPPNEIRVFTYSNDNDLDVSNLTSVKVFFDNLIQRYSDKYNVKIKPIKFEVDVNTNYASATVEITPNYLRQSTNVEAIIITTLYNALLLKQIIEGNTLSLREV
jgi:hypothetical protein